MKEIPAINDLSEFFHFVPVHKEFLTRTHKERTPMLLLLYFIHM